jgi:hypothetical protein
MNFTSLGHDLLRWFVFANFCLSQIYYFLSSPVAADRQHTQTRSGTRGGCGSPRSRSGIKVGSHDKLMYTLGVNLARQFGDIRPLIADGEEIGNVARGILDTVVGRSAEEEQEALLAWIG